MHMKPHWALHMYIGNYHCIYRQQGYQAFCAFEYCFLLTFCFISLIYLVYVTNFSLYFEPLLLLLFLFTISKYYSQLSCLIIGYNYNFYMITIVPINMICYVL